MLSEGTLILLGLERDIWEHTPESEKTRYKQVALCFYLLNILSVISGGYLMHLMGFGWTLAIPLGAVSAFILMSILRFSLIIYRRSVFDYEKEREKLDEKLAVKSADQSAVNQPKPSIQDTAKKIKAAVLAPIRTITEYVKNGKGYTKIPGLGGLIRSSILLMVGFLIIIPLSALLHKSFVEKINEDQRNAYIADFQQQESSRLGNKVLELEREIEQIESRTKTGRENSSANTLAQNDARILELKQQIEELKQKSAADTRLFTEKLTDRYFLVFTLTAIRNTPGFYLSLIIILTLIILPHWILHRLKVDPTGYYAEEAVLRYRSIIDEEYKKTETEGYEYLEREYDYTPGEYRRNIFWDNPPYCTVPRVHFSKKIRISKSDFLKMEGAQ